AFPRPASVAAPALSPPPRAPPERWKSASRCAPASRADSTATASARSSIPHCIFQAMALIQFVENYDDLSTDRGFQFKFYCDKCRNGYMSGFQASIVGTAGHLIPAVRRILGVV